MARNRWLAALLALALACAQQLGAAHAALHHHLPGDSGADAATPASPVPGQHGPVGDGPCLQCLLLTPLATGEPSPAPAFVAFDCGAVPAAAPASRVGLLLHCVPPARGPPRALH